MSQASVTLQRLTTNATENRIDASAISPDGKYLAYSDKTGAYLRLLSTGEVHPLLPKASDVTFLGWFPDSSQLLASWADPAGKQASVGSIHHGWQPAANERRRLVGFGFAGRLANCISQGSRIRGNGAGNLADAGRWVRSAKADFVSGGRVRLTGLVARWALDCLCEIQGWAQQYEEHWIELFNLEQGTKRVVLSDPHLDGWGLIWLPDGRLVYAMDEPPPSQNSSNFWAASIDLSTGRFVGTPARITSGDGFAVKPSVTADSKRLVFNRAKPQADVYVSEFFAKGPRLSTPRRLTLDEADDFPFDWTSDNKAVLFISNRTGTDNIFRQRIDETSAEMLVFGPEKKSDLPVESRRNSNSVSGTHESKRQFAAGTADASAYQWGPAPDRA